MNPNLSNLPNGTLLRDIDQDECPTCEGQGQVWGSVMEDDGLISERMVTCEDCSGLGVENTRAAR